MTTLSTESAFERLLDTVRQLPRQLKVKLWQTLDAEVGRSASRTDTNTATPRLRTLGDLAHSELFGLWRDRADVGDSVEFARRLRADAWSRSV
jgi:hypothetical protein